MNNHIQIINTDGCFFLFKNFQVAIVVGGGNKFHGSSWVGSNGLGSSVDYIGYRLLLTLQSFFCQRT
ncbi:hypothetical protein Hanom_Chr09g00801741 [Helianthus anomalus]